MVRAVCIQCGAAKRYPWQKCWHCGFDPQIDEEALVKSVYLSVFRLDPDVDDDQYRMCAEELRHAAETIRQGGQIRYDPDELARLLANKRLVESMELSWFDVLWYLCRVFFPGLLFVAAIAGIYYLLVALFPVD